jgi:hypothetical protein
VDDAVDESTDDGSSASDGSSNSSGGTGDSDDLITDDGAVDDDTKHMGDDDVNVNYLSQDERTQIILEKCNTTPLARALSLIETIGNHVDPQGEKILILF